MATAAAKPRTDPRPVAVDIAPLADQLVVLQDSRGGTYVVAAALESGARAWYGTGKKLHEQVIIGRSRDGAAWSLGTWAPRLDQLRSGAIQRAKDGSFAKQCDGKDDAILTELAGDKARAVIARSTFLSPAMVRRAHLLARDDRGIYYYVDRLSEAHGGKGYRVFVGKKGAMKQVPLTDVASDSAGQVFATRTGALRLTHTRSDALPATTAWIKGERRTELIQLDVSVNSRVIYRDLGIYTFMGTICDNI